MPKTAAITRLANPLPLHLVPVQGTPSTMEALQLIPPLLGIAKSITEEGQGSKGEEGTIPSALRRASPPTL